MYGSDLKNLAAELAALLDIPVEMDPRDLTLPGILITPGKIAFDRLAGDLATSEIEAWIVTADTNPVTALDELGDILLLLREHVTINEVEPVTLQLTNQAPDPLPALRIPIPIEILFKKEETP